MSSTRPNQVNQESNESEAKLIGNTRYIHDDHHDIPAVASFELLRSNFHSTSTFYSFPRKFTEIKNEQQDVVPASPKITPSNHL